MNPETVDTNPNGPSADNISLEDVNTAPQTEEIVIPDNGTSPESGTETPPKDPPAEPGASSGGDTPGASTPPGDSDLPEGGTSGEPAKPTSPADPPDTEADNLSDVEAFNALSEETGVEVTTDDDIVDALIELNSLRQSGSPSNLSPALLEAQKVEQAGGNLAEHFARTGMDFDKMDGTDVLRQQFFKAEAKLHNNNPKFAQMKFERSFNQKYGNWLEYERLTSPEDKEAFAEEHGGIENIDYEKMMFETDTAMAKDEMKEWQKTAAPEVKDNSTGMTPEEETAYTENYQAQVTKSWEGYESLAVDMGEGLEDFSLGLNDKTRPLVEGWINNPGTFLQDIGFDGQKIDTDRLLPIMTAIAELSNGTFGPRIAKYVVDSDNIETFKKQIDAPPTSPVVPVPDTGTKDAWDELGEKAEAARKETERR